MDKKIEDFIKEQKNLTICTTVNDIPICANCFYSYMEAGNFLIFKSNRKTQHITNALINHNVAGTILPDITKTGRIKGVQFSGKFIIPTDDLLAKAQKIYYTKHPFALPMLGELWMISLVFVKMTDNTMGFGKKIIWQK